METRRSFLTGLAVVGVCSGLSPDAMLGQNPAASPTTQKPVPGHPAETDVPVLPDPEKKILENNDKDMKKKVEQLYELAKDLKEEVEKTDSTRVLSLDLVRKSEAIEKLAHDIRNRSKG
jgi:hypothetical protein